MLSCTSSMWRCESHTNLPWQCTSVCMAGRQIICRSYARWTLRWLNDSIFIPPAAPYSSSQGSRRTCMVIMPSLWLGWWHGNCSTMIFAVPIWALTPSDALSRHISSDSTSCIQRIRDTVRVCIIQIDIYITLRWWDHCVVEIKRHCRKA